MRFSLGVRNCSSSIYSAVKPLGSSMAEVHTKSSNVFRTRKPAVFTMRLIRLASRSFSSSFNRSVTYCSVFSNWTERPSLAMPPSFTCRIISSISSDIRIASHQAIVGGEVGIVMQCRRTGQLQRIRPVLLFRNHVIALPEAVHTRAAIFTGELQRICTQGGIAVRDNFTEQLECILSLPAAGLFQECLPLLRHLVEEAGMLNCSRLFAENGHILRPVIDLIIGFVAPAVVANRVVVMKKFHMVKENLSLHRFTGQHGRKAVFVGLNGYETIFVHCQCGIAEYRERILRQAQETRFVLFPKLLNQQLLLVVRALGS